MTRNIEFLNPAFDRFQEAHFWIHMLEKYYHTPEPFRWHLNVFLKAIKEVPSILSMAAQKDKDFMEWLKPHRKRLKEDALLSKLSKQRDFVVHQGVLSLGSSGTIGITKGRGIKFGLNFPIDPSQDSDEAMEHFIYVLARTGDFFGFLADDEDTLPCVERIWKLPDFEEEIIELCSTAWVRVGEVLSDAVVFFDEERPTLDLSCRHSDQDVHFKLYSRKPLREKLRTYRSQEGFKMEKDAKDAEDLSEEPIEAGTE